VDRLVTAGLVHRDTHAGDRRQVTLTLTDDGQANAEQVIAVEVQMYKALDALTAGQPVSQTVKTLRKLADAFPVAEPPPTYRIRSPTVMRFTKGVRHG
jgi:MarR family transcriptional regulator, organic hydroperoxide resistance regulator